MTVDPHLEEVVRYSAAASRAAAVRFVPTLGGFVTALALMPDSWLVMTAFYVGACLLGLLDALYTWRKLRKQLASAPAVPADAVEVERHGNRLREICAVLWELAFLLGAGWLWSALEGSPFAHGLLFAAVLLGFGAARDVVVRWSIGRWERRNGRILTSLLLGAGEVFYVERGARAA